MSGEAITQTVLSTLLCLLLAACTVATVTGHNPAWATLLAAAGTAAVATVGILLGRNRQTA